MMVCWQKHKFCTNSHSDYVQCDGLLTETQSYVLNFHGRVTQASVKNFQIVHDNDGKDLVYPEPHIHIPRRSTDSLLYEMFDEI